MTSALEKRGITEDVTVGWALPCELGHDFLTRTFQSRESAGGSGTKQEVYTLEDAWRDQLAQLPSEEQVSALVTMLHTSELREIAADIINDVIIGCKAGNIVEVAEAVNGWIATAEETVAYRRKLRHILAARRSVAVDS